MGKYPKDSEINQRTEIEGEILGIEQESIYNYKFIGGDTMPLSNTMPVDPRIPMFYDEYKPLYNGVLVPNLEVGEVRRHPLTGNPLDKVNDKVFLGKELEEIAKCIDVEDIVINGRQYRYLVTKDYTILLDGNNTLVTNSMTHSVQAFEDGGFIGNPQIEIKGYDQNDYRIYGYLGRGGRLLRTYSIISEKDFKFIGRYGAKDIIAPIITDRTDHIESYLVETHNGEDGILPTNMVYANGTTTGLVYPHEIQRIIKKKRLGGRITDVINNSELSEFVMQRVIRTKLDLKTEPTHAIMFRCNDTN